MAEFSRCETCRHWAESPVKLLASTVTPEGRYGGRVEMPGTWGDCRAIHHLSGDSHAREGEVPEPDLARGDEVLDPNAVVAYLSDGSEYFASITTRNDFGCVLHEAASMAGYPVCPTCEAAVTDLQPLVGETPETRGPNLGFKDADVLTGWTLRPCGHTVPPGDPWDEAYLAARR